MSLEIDPKLQPIFDRVEPNSIECVPLFGLYENVVDDGEIYRMLLAFSPTLLNLEKIQTSLGLITDINDLSFDKVDLHACYHADCAQFDQIYAAEYDHAVFGDETDTDYEKNVSVALFINKKNGKDITNRVYLASRLPVKADQFYQYGISDD